MAAAGLNFCCQGEMRACASMLSPSRLPPSPLESKTEFMKAVVIEKHGEASVLEVKTDFPAPTPNSRAIHVEVKISAAGLNPVDFKMRKYNISDFAYP